MFFPRRQIGNQLSSIGNDDGMAMCFRFLLHQSYDLRLFSLSPPVPAIMYRIRETAPIFADFLAFFVVALCIKPNQAMFSPLVSSLECSKSGNKRKSVAAAVPCCLSGK